MPEPRLVPALQAINCLSLAKPIAKAVGRYHVKHFPRDAVVVFGAELEEFLLERRRAVDILRSDRAGRVFVALHRHTSIDVTLCGSCLIECSGQGGNDFDFLAARSHVP